jgi:hypothetical protein
MQTHQLLEDTMKKTLLATAMLAVLCVGVANAQWVPGSNVGQPPGMNLQWTSCDAPTNPIADVSPTCLSNTAFAPNLAPQVSTHRDLVGTYIYPQGFTALDATDILIDIQTATSPIPCWWNMVTTNALRASAISLVEILPGDGGCGDYWSENPNGIIFSGFARSNPAPNRLRLDASIAVASTDGRASPQPNPGDEVYAFTYQIKPTNSANASCPGCLEPACIFLSQIILSRADGPIAKIQNPSTRAYATWRGGTIIGVGGCFVDPTTNKTWGSVKTLYR